jgi:hypothetical protein
MSQGKGKFQKMKKVFNKKEEGEDFSSNEKFTFENDDNKKVENNQLKQKTDFDKVYKFRNTVDTVEIKSFKGFNIDVEDDPEKIKCSNCVNQCVIY